MGPVEALKLALSQEAEAVALYTKLQNEHQGLRETFSFLIDEEHKHMKLLENKIAEATKY